MNEPIKDRLVTIEEAREMLADHNIEVMEVTNSAIEELASVMADLSQRDTSLKSKIDTIQYVLIGIIVTFFLAFLSFVFEANNFHSVSLENFTDKVTSIDLLPAHGQLSQEINRVRGEVKRVEQLSSKVAKSEDLANLVVRIDSLAALIDDLIEANNTTNE